MNQILESFNAREEASLVLLTLGLTLLLAKNADLRASVKDLIKAFLLPAIVTPFVILAAWSGGLVWFLAQKGYWDLSMLKDTLVWFLAAVSLMLKGSRDGEKPGFFRSTILELFAFSVFLQFAVEAYVMKFWQELLMLPVLFVVIIGAEVARSKPEHARVAKLFYNVSAFFGIALLINAILKISHEPKNFFTLDNLKTFLLEPVLTLWSLPIVALFVLFLVYDRLFRLVGFAFRENDKLALYGKFAVLRSCNLSIARCRKLSGEFQNELAFAQNREEIRWVVSKYLTPERSPYIGPESIEVTNVRLAPWTNALGIEQRMVYVDWKNVGPDPIVAVMAKLIPFDKDGKPIDDVVEEYTIFSGYDGAVEIGESYTEPEGEGYSFGLLWGTPASVKVEIVKAKRPVESLQSSLQDSMYGTGELSLDA